MKFLSVKIRISSNLSIKIIHQTKIQKKIANSPLQRATVDLEIFV